MPNRRHDTAIRAAFDAHRQQEEGARHAVRIAGQRQQSALAGILGSRSPHQKWIINIHKEFRKEIATVPADGIASFLLHYACCEANARILIAASNGTPPHKAENIECKLDSINHALQQYQIIINDNVVNGVFAETFRSFATASARRLRDKIIHLFQPSAIDQIRARGNQLFADMNSVIQGLEEKAETYEGF